MGKIRASRNSGGIIMENSRKASDDYVVNRNNKHGIKIDQAIARSPEKHRADLKEFAKYMQDNGKAIGTISNYVQHLSYVLKDFKGDIKSYKASDWIKFWENRPADKKSQNTSRLCQVSMEALLKMEHGKNNIAKIQEIVYSKYDKIIVPLKEHQQKDCLTYEEIKKLIDVSMNSRDRFFVYGLYETACRISEFLAIRLCDIDFKADPMEINVRESKTKGGKDKPVFILDSKPFLLAWLKDHPFKTEFKNNEDFYNSKTPLIVSLNHRKPLTSSGALMELKRLAERAGMTKRIYNHLFRRSRVTNLYRNEGFDIYELKELGRWKKLDMLDVYIGQNMRKLGQKLKKNNLSAAEKESILAEERKIKEFRQSMEKIFCPNCKTENEYNNVYCSYCAAPLTEKAKFEAWKQKKKIEEQMELFGKALAKLGMIPNKSELKKKLV